MKNVVYLIVLFLISNQAHAIDFDQKPNILGIGLSYGGDTLTKAGSDELNAGEELSIYYGRAFPLDGTKQLQINLGYKDDLIEGLNGEASFSRIPIELLVFKPDAMNRLGIGLTYHFNPTYEQTISGSTSKLEFDNSLGMLVQLEFLSKSFISVGIRYEVIDYSTTTPAFFPGLGTTTNKIKGNNIGIYAGFHL